MPKIFNKRTDDIPDDAVYVGRPTKWGNPFSHQSGTRAQYQVDSRQEAVWRFRDWLLNEPEAQELRDSLEELRGKDLVCWCVPMMCHAEVLMELANA
jgi:hypothetical protein